MTRREFPRAVKVAVIRRAMRESVIYCEACGGIAKRFQIDHVIADAHGGEPVLSNAELICEACWAVKNPADTRTAAKIKRQEAGHLGARKHVARPLHSRGFDRKPRVEKLPIPPRTTVAGHLIEG